MKSFFVFACDANHNNARAHTSVAEFPSFFLFASFFPTITFTTFSLNRDRTILACLLWFGTFKLGTTTTTFEEEQPKTNHHNDTTMAPPPPAPQPHSPNPHHAGGAEALRLKAGENGKLYNGETGIVRQRTEVEKQVLSHEQQADEIVYGLPPSDAESQEEAKALPNIDLFLPDVLKNAVFVGHLVTDLDSVAGAIGAAALYGGTPALASPINSETVFAFQEWGVPMPQYIEDVIEENPKADVCLVDHQQTSQLNPCIPVDNIVGVIDHHALQSKTIVTGKPIYVDIRPWGSMSTIIAHTFLTHKRRPPKAVAGMLLCAILSDTLNLLGPTTTEWYERFLFFGCGSSHDLTIGLVSHSRLPL